MTVRYCAIAVVGTENCGKSALAGSLKSVTPADNCFPAPCDSRIVVDRLESERRNGYSEVASYISLPSSEDHEIELIVAPGRRKFWKWVDFSLVDSDACIIVVRVTDGVSLDIPALIEPVAQCVAFGVPVAAVVLNQFESSSDAYVARYRQLVIEDLRRILPPSKLPPILSARITDGSGLKELLSMMQTVQLRPVTPGPFQLAINTVFTKGEAVIVGGKVLSGTVHVGDRLLLMPSQVPVTVGSVQISGSHDVESASNGRVIGVKLEGVSKNHVSTGMVLVSDVKSGRAARTIQAEINLFNSKFPVRVGLSPMVTIGSCHVHAKLTQIMGDQEELLLGDSAVVTLSLTKTAFAHPFPSPFGRILLRHENVLIAVGVIRSVLD